MADGTNDPRLPDLLAQARWQVRSEAFVLAGLHPRERVLALQLMGGVTSPFTQLLCEPDGVTLVLPEADWRALRPAFPQARALQPLRLIGHTPARPQDLVGFLAAASGALARAGVPLLALCGLRHDHLLVRAADLDRALRALGELAP